MSVYFHRLTHANAKIECDNLGYDTRDASLVMLHKTLYHHCDIPWEPAPKSWSKMSVEEIFELSDILGLKNIFEREYHGPSCLRALQIAFKNFATSEELSEESRSYIHFERTMYFRRKFEQVPVCMKRIPIDFIDLT